MHNPLYNCIEIAHKKAACWGYFQATVSSSKDPGKIQGGH